MNEYKAIYRPIRKHGLHASLAAILVPEIQREYEIYPDIKITLTNEKGQTANGKGIMDILCLVVQKGRPLEIKVAGDYKTETLKECAEHLGAIVTSSDPKY